jgi:hypothetical protein
MSPPPCKDLKVLRGKIGKMSVNKITQVANAHTYNHVLDLFENMFKCNKNMTTYHIIIKNI